MTQQTTETTTPTPQFTPGPWEIRETGTWPETNHHLAIIGKHHPTGRIALIEGFDRDAANAHLIASAPDLYAALKAIVHVTEHGMVLFHKLTEEHAEAALAALAKAEGRERT